MAKKKEDPATRAAGRVSNWLISSAAINGSNPTKSAIFPQLVLTVAGLDPAIAAVLAGLVFGEVRT